MEQTGSSAFSESVVVHAVPIGGGTPVVIATAPVRGVVQPLLAADGDTVTLASAGQVLNVAVADAPVALPELPPSGIPEHAVADSDFVYTALVPWEDRITTPSPVRVLKTPRRGGPAVVLHEEQHRQPFIGDIVDAGDALLFTVDQLTEPGDSETRGQLRRIPKDGSAWQRLRADLDFRALDDWLGWDDGRLDVTVADEHGDDYRAWVNLGEGAPTPLPYRLDTRGPIAHTSGGTLTLAHVDGSGDLEGEAIVETGRNLSVLACSRGEHGGVGAVGIAVSGRDIFVAYQVTDVSQRRDLVIARLPARQ